jgi:hypothetical protein
LIKESGSYLILRTAKWHGCPVVVPRAYVRYERIKRFLLAKMLALSLTSVFESRTQAIQGPTWKASATLLADRCWRLIPRGIPKAQVAAELSIQARTLRERYPGARAQASRQKGARIERRPRPRRTDDGALAKANKAEAATTKLELASQS